MMESRDISLGARVKITANGTTHLMFISNISEGQVTFHVSRRGKLAKGGWWLPYDYVREHGELILPGEAGRRPGDRRAVLGDR